MWRSFGLLAMVALLCGATGCYKYHPIAAAELAARDTKLDDRVIRFHEGASAREMEVKTLQFPYVGGVVKDHDNGSHAVTMDVRMMEGLEIRTGRHPIKVAAIIVGTTLGVGAVAAGVASTVAWVNK